MIDAPSPDAWKAAVLDRLPEPDALRDVEREAMDYDVVVVGAGPAGVAAAIRLKQCAQRDGREISVAVLEKSAEVGGHILAGAVIDPRALDELTPDWTCSAPLGTPVRGCGRYPPTSGDVRGDRGMLAHPSA